MLVPDEGGGGEFSVANLMGHSKITKRRKKMKQFIKKNIYKKKKINTFE